MTDHFQVCKVITDLDRKETIVLGTALGLSYIKLKRMDTIPEDMIAGWLRGDDAVRETSGPPSWASLAAALNETGHTDIANKIKKGMFVH